LYNYHLKLKKCEYRKAPVNRQIYKHFLSSKSEDIARQIKRLVLFNLCFIGFL